MASSPESLAAQEEAAMHMEKMVEDLDKSCLRKYQFKMYQCSAACCEKEFISALETRSCLEKCAVGMKRAEDFIQEELGNFHNRLHRCILGCQDAEKDKLGPDPSDLQMKDAEKRFETCAIKCVQNHISQIPDVRDKIKKYLGRSSP